MRVFLGTKLAGRQGFEPRYADPESAVLPLDDLPPGHTDRSKWAGLVCQAMICFQAGPRDPASRTHGVIPAKAGIHHGPPLSRG